MFVTSLGAKDLEAMPRLAWLKKGSRWAGALLLLSLFLILGPLHLKEPWNFVSYFGAYFSGVVLLLRVYTLPAKQWWTKLIKILVLLLMGLILLVLTFVIPLSLSLMATPGRIQDIDCGPSLECRVYHRGAFGKYWQDLVQRQRYLGFIYVETPLTQFDREVVNSLRFDAQAQGLILEVEEYGQAPRTVNIALPLPARAVQ
ncbi:hypothetical protein LNV08_10305 [Paucibacter sp. TC2R-5]|uniref:hypothetical protein n=1 Tax=Paucibacter sp. TC2R-5 TaxID=2893555 RepID=UPI0021E49CCA|nr:hypothetical protein [Paucibacter sp. TC2R-5]MCV2359364.1 hypothetical protein [Paucibacter sp. TC2R-5]